MMNRPVGYDVVAMLVLVAAGAGARLMLQDIPNFAPVAALAMFAGFFFRDWRWALCVPIGIMAVSDLAIGGYHWFMMLAVYGSLCLPIAWRSLLREHVKLDQPTASQGAGSALLLAGGSLLGSLLFFGITNGAEWLVDGFRDQPTYSATLSGLVRCYVQAIPFFRYTLLGDLIFCGVFFGSYAVAASLHRSASPARELVEEVGGE